MEPSGGACASTPWKHQGLDSTRDIRIFFVVFRGSSNPMLETTAEVACPHCGETITLLLDLSIESQTYIEDCSVCCQPMSVSYTVENGELADLTVESAN
jgi:Cysteine-rich CPXCG